MLIRFKQTASILCWCMAWCLLTVISLTHISSHQGYFYRGPGLSILSWTEIAKSKEHKQWGQGLTHHAYRLWCCFYSNQWRSSCFNNSFSFNGCINTVQINYSLVYLIDNKTTIIHNDLIENNALLWESSQVYQIRGLKTNFLECELSWTTFYI